MLANGAKYLKRYDGNGNIVEDVSPNGYIARNMYDSANRLIEKTISKTGVQDEHETFGYDGLSRMVAVLTPKTGELETSKMIV